ncbi:MAG: PEP-CTERM sorting domain-containing protein [Planctomycetes bacterium]|nr:PEP-CTERM sorting domain-containing protein [Planctomycetota bacterium]
MVHRTYSGAAACLAAGLFLLAASPLSAATVPFTEDFATDHANWFANSAGTAPLVFNAAGGPDGGSFASTTLNFANLTQPGFSAPFFRGQENFNSSGGAFLGNWITDGVSTFSLMLRHDAGETLQFFTRIAMPANPPPGGGVLSFVQVPSGVWTPVSLAIDPTNPALQFLEGPGFGQIFSNVGRIQVGINIPPGLAGADRVVSFALDKVSVVPEPATLALLGAGALVVLRRTRRRSVAS